jgi:hypothetical protein
VTNRNERLTRWIHASHAALSRIEVHMIPPTQDLARLDDELLAMDEAVADNSLEAVLTAFDLNTRRFALSRLWVLGAYELARTVEARLRPYRGQALHDHAVRLKRRFERLRVPLAKFESASRHPDDWPIAYPGYRPGSRSVGWLVADSEFIERNELADALLDFLEELGRAARGGFLDGQSL